MHTTVESPHGMYDPIHLPRLANFNDAYMAKTADVYSNGESERIIAKAIQKYEIPRSNLVILSKCYFGVASDNSQPRIGPMSTNDGPMVNQVGLSRKHIFDAVEASVKRLGT